MNEIELAIKSANCTPKFVAESTIVMELTGKGNECFRVSYPIFCCSQVSCDNCFIISNPAAICLELSVIMFTFIPIF